MPFYKRTGDTIITAETVHAPGYTLTTETAITQKFPVDGWVNAASLDAALPLLSASVIDGVPQSVTMRQAKSAILNAKWLGASDEQVQENGFKLFDSLPEPNRSHGRIAWRESGAFERNNSWVNAMAQALGKTQNQIDVLFIAAAKL